MGKKEHPRALCPLLCFTVGRVDTSQFHRKDGGGAAALGPRCSMFLVKELDLTYWGTRADEQFPELLYLKKMLLFKIFLTNYLSAVNEVIVSFDQ